MQLRRTKYCSVPVYAAECKGHKTGRVLLGGQDVANRASLLGWFISSKCTSFNVVVASRDVKVTIRHSGFAIASITA